QPSARPSLIVHSTALRFATGRAPGCARQTGQVRVFGSAKYASSQRQNIFVRVFRGTWISRPTTASHSTTEQLLGLAQCALDVAFPLANAEPVLERTVHLDQPQLVLARLESKLQVADEDGARAIEDAHVAEELPAREHEPGSGIGERLHRSRSGTVSNPR